MRGVCLPVHEKPDNDGPDPVKKVTPARRKLEFVRVSAPRKGDPCSG